MSLNKQLQQQLLEIARDAIRCGLKSGKHLSLDLTMLPNTLKEPRATFVTLEIKGQLRGCIGMLEAKRPLAEDIAKNAFAAAFRDPRFPVLETQELAQLNIHLSILSPAEPIVFSSENDLIKQIRPNIDGLILQEGFRRGTFLPIVWESLPKPEQFLRHLKQKAGLPADYWSDSLHVSRYTTEMIS